MSGTSEFTATGRIIALRDTRAVFQPVGTNYELLLEMHGAAGDTPLNTLISGRLHGQARKLMTVSSGGNFIAPIFGPPRTIQGRVLHMDGRKLVLKAGVSFAVDLPFSDNAIDLARGPIAVGVIVNATLLPGATFELAQPALKQPA